eukprot:gene4220-4637_t
MPVELKSLQEYISLQNEKETKFVLFFWAEWHEPSRRDGQMQSVYAALEEKYPTIKFRTIEAEGVPELSEKLSVTLVPTFFTCIGSKIVAKFEGATPSTVSKLVKDLNEISNVSSFTNNAEEDEKKKKKEVLNRRLEQLIYTAPVMLFMKGSPAQPRCGFSRQMVELLQQSNVPFASFDILTDEEVRQGLKEYSDWPTYPQLYVKGQLVGGLDIVKEMAQQGNLIDQFDIQHVIDAANAAQSPAAVKPLQERLHDLINQAQVMLFMKGTPDAPRCGFSSTIVSILKDSGVEYSSFNILTDEEVRQGLKEYSDWPTYPQLYVKGQLVGGLDIVKEMVQQGSLKEQLGI